MNQIKIKSLTLLNFKGIRSLTISEFGKETNIFGANGTGKTTIADAFSWLLFGKDANDRQQFEIKTLDPQNNVIPKLEHEVSAVLEVNGEEIHIKRILREKWVKPRGTTETVFQGNETVFYWNDVPLLASDYSAKISKIMDEKVFKMITNPLAFNSLKWQDQRKMLLEIVGGITDQELAEGNAEFETLLSNLSNKTLDEYQKQVAASVRKAKGEIKNIPHRIDEVERGKPEALDFDTIEKTIISTKEELVKVDEMISDRTAAHQDVLNRKSDIQGKINGVDSKLAELNHKAKEKAKQEERDQSSTSGQIGNKISEKRSLLSTAKSVLQQAQEIKSNVEADIESFTKRNDDIRDQWHKINKQEFAMDDKDCKCPTCQQELDADKLEEKREELQSNFNLHKRKRLEELDTTGARNKKIIERSQQQLENLDTRISDESAKISTLESEIESLEKDLSIQEDAYIESYETILSQVMEVMTDEFKSLEDQKSELKEKLNNIQPIAMEDLKEKKETLNSELSTLRSQLSKRDHIEAADKRKAQLMEEEKTLGQQIADYEKEQYVIDSFIREKIDRLEAMINLRFEMVNFKMFETQVNGGEVETCKALIDGVPFSDANTASKINAGIDIINTLCNHYKVSAPIFIDNRESVINLIDTESQVINLIVSPQHQELTVEYGAEVELETA